MNEIQIKDKRFRISIPEAQVLENIQQVADRINADYDGKDPLFLGVLNGSFMFASDLMKRITIPCNISFVKFSSYVGTASSGDVKQLIGVNEDITGRDIIIVEDIVESGKTMKEMIEQLKAKNPSSIRICTLFFKPSKLEEDLAVDYVAMEIPDDFIVGFGLDYDQYGRNLKDIYTIVE